MRRLELTLLDQERTPYDDAVGQIAVGDFTERFPVSLSYWSAHEYRAQWKEALGKIVGSAPTAAVIASIDDPTLPGARVWLWSLYQLPEEIAVRNRLLLLDDYDSRFRPEEVESWMLEREPTTEDGNPISEWRVERKNLIVRVS